MIHQVCLAKRSSFSRTRIIISIYGIEILVNEVIESLYFFLGYYYLGAMQGEDPSSITGMIVSPS